MSTFIDLDSIWRDRDVYPNENNYELEPKQVDTWFKSARSVRAFPQNPSTQPLEFATTINIKYLTLPYSETLSEFPRIYVNFRSKRYKDIHLINAIDGKQPTAKFICNFDRIQTDRNGNPLWIHYRCNMEQTMRFERGEPAIFQVTTRVQQIRPTGGVAHLDHLLMSRQNKLPQIGRADQRACLKAHVIAAPHEFYAFKL